MIHDFAPERFFLLSSQKLLFSTIFFLQNCRDEARAELFNKVMHSALNVPRVVEESLLSGMLHHSCHKVTLTVRAERFFSVLRLSGAG
jgi:hypothetical protein